MPDQVATRRRFPALQGDTVFLENAGGSQLPAQVIDRMTRYLGKTYVQLGAGYPLSQICTQTVDHAHDFARMFVNAEQGEVILGSSTTALLNMLADCYSQVLKPGQRAILAESGHEANLGCWKRLAAKGIEIHWWRVDPETGAQNLADLEVLLTGGAALVALPHVSNLLGEIIDLATVVKLAHRVGARVVADGVAFAPHRAIDTAAWDVDWYAYSAYKVYGPHMAVLYGKREAMAELTGPNHFFIPDDDLPYKFEPGGPNHESCAGLLGLADYLKYLADVPEQAPCDRTVLATAYAKMQEWEQPLLTRLLDFLRSRDDLRLIGPDSTGPERVGTVSFVHSSRTSREITAEIDPTGIAIRHGHMYAYHLCQALGLDPEDGVVRVSFVHYNTVEEIERLIEVLDGLL